MASFTHPARAPEEMAAQAAGARSDARRWNGGVRLETLANLAHELRTPIQVLLGYLDILREELSDALEARPRKIIDRINANAHDLAQTVENVMEFALAGAKAEASTDEEISIRELLADITPALEAANHGKGLTVEFNLDAAPDAIRSRPRAIRSILLNLAVNAIKFTDIGMVQIVVRGAPASAPQDSIGFGHAIEFEVRDTGPGIDPAFIARAFQTCAQLSHGSARRHRGMGLGLAVVQRNVEALGGELGVETAPNAGSTFRVRIPLAVPPIRHRR
ncbi:MAG TPA: HAMP domain-containing sensor histidine kinase [Candidatus Binataceae bacterium]